MKVLAMQAFCNLVVMVACLHPALWDPAEASRSNSSETGLSTIQTIAGQIEALKYGPEIVLALGQLIAASAPNDFRLSGNESLSLTDNRFRSSVIHLINKKDMYFRAIEGNVQMILLHCLDVPRDVKRAIRLLGKGNSRLANRFATIAANDIKLMLAKSINLTKSINDQLNEWQLHLDRLIHALKRTRAHFALQQEVVEQEANFIDHIAQLTEKEYKKAENVYNKASQTLDEARTALRKVLNTMSQGQKSRMDRDGETDSSESPVAESVEDTLAIEDIKRLREALSKAQEKYDEATRRYNQYEEKLAEARQNRIKTTTELERITNVQAVIAKAMRFTRNAVSSTENFAKYFDTLGSVLENKFKKGLDNLLAIIDIIAESNTSKALVEDTSLRDRLIRAGTNIITEASVINFLAATYGKVSAHYITDNMATLGKLQSDKTAQVEQILATLQSNLDSAKNDITKHIAEYSSHLNNTRREWNEELNRFRERLRAP